MEVHPVLLEKNVFYIKENASHLKHSFPGEKTSHIGIVTLSVDTQLIKE